ncbi:transaldolase [Arenicella xantha]|uniref:Transaldolase n=1 Tax=Arenicella xantha TaxID=644221 RepID=A0A395JSK0_9GAMM|nr:transaldolase [Arenicella xantha]RBP51680.1 transaldolase [Arenicella xantha]
MNKLQQLRKMTTVVADTGDIDAIRQYHPQDATTNPSLLLSVARDSRFAAMVQRALDLSDGSVGDAVDQFSVEVGCAILKLIPGRISTEVDARLSFDTDATVAKAHKIISEYEKRGINAERVLIKIASTWEGIKAAERLERESIHCNLTLLFGFAQAVACAEAKVTLISPFVGRILDWYQANTDQFNASSDADPGVKSVAQIYQYYKEFGYKTIVMGASFRNTGQIESLAGCDYLTISPTYLEQLEKDNGELMRKLTPPTETPSLPGLALSETEFRWQMNQDPMATEKLAEGIRGFARDQELLEQIFAEMLTT